MCDIARGRVVKAECHGYFLDGEGKGSNSMHSLLHNLKASKVQTVENPKHRHQSLLQIVVDSLNRLVGA